MAERDWTFWVHLVKDGGREGLLIGRKQEPAGPTEHAYFFVRNAEGLGHNEQIFRLCKEWTCEIHGLHRDEIRIFDLLRKCASFAAGQSALPTQIPLVKVFHNTAEAPEKALPRLFETVKTGTLRNADSRLRQFLVDWATFRKRVLDLHSVRGELVLSVKLRELSVIAPNEVMPEEGLDYLEHVKQVLRIGAPDEPDWFRKQGPVAADFKAMMVYARTTRLADLRKLVLGNPFSVLYGAAATGKTVLVRSFALNLYEEGWPRVYLFDERHFDIDILARVINRIHGVVILENVHRQIANYQQLYSLLRPDPRRHVIFTTRVPLNALQNSRSDDLAALPTVSLSPFEDVDGVIQLFATKEMGPRWSPKLKDAVWKVSKNNLWLLAYALRGCKGSDCRGDPTGWISNEVKRDLRDLEMCGDLHAARYPEILVSLSPLYVYEIPTAQNYLVDRLGFDKECLNALVRRGEIVRVEGIKGEIMYSLPHSSLATAYWQCGKEYRTQAGIPGWYEFVCNYAEFDTPNASVISAAIVHFLGHGYGDMMD